MKKDIEWLVKMINEELDILRQRLESGKGTPNQNTFDDGRGWALSHVLRMMYYPDKLEELSKELPVIPKYVADWIEEMKQDERPLYSVMSSLMNKTNHEWAVWKSANKNFSEIVAQAWLDGYTVEEAPLYYAKSNLTELPSWSQGFDDAYYFGARGEDRHWQIYLGRKAQVLPRTKANWSELNVDDSIAIFELAEEDLNEKER